MYEGSQNALNVMQEKVGDLIVRAPIDGQLTSLDAEIGESKNKGERLGQIDVMNGFKVTSGRRRTLYFQGVHRFERDFRLQR